MMTSSGDHHAERDAGVRRHVQIGAANIEVAVAAAHEQQRGAAVDDDAERRNPDRRSSPRPAQAPPGD